MAAAKQPAISVRLMEVDALTPNPNNARTHPPEQVDQIARSIREFGFTNPILIDTTDDNLIVAGHGRRLAVLDIMDGGYEVKLPGGDTLPAGMVPVIDCAGWTASQRRAYTLADNAIADQAEWDQDLLTLELGDLSDEGEVALDLTGISPEQIQEALSRRPERSGFLDDLTVDGENEGEDGGKTAAAKQSGTGVAITFNVSPEERDTIINWLNQIKKEIGVKTAAAALAAFAKDRMSAPE